MPPNLLPLDLEQIDGWRCPHCNQQCSLDGARTHARTHDCPSCLLEMLVVDSLLAEQRKRRLN